MEEALRSLRRNIEALRSCQAEAEKMRQARLEAEVAALECEQRLASLRAGIRIDVAKLCGEALG
jgi:hypothetical protein